MNYEKINQIEQYFKNKFEESPIILSTATKNAEHIKEINSESEEIQLDENIKLIKPKREISLFNQKCKHCQKSIFKKQDISIFYKHNYCYECYVQFGEI